jgi:hypothetical protein
MVLIGLKKCVADLGLGVARKSELVAHVDNADLCLQICQTHADTVARPISEWNKRIRLDLIFVLRQEAAIFLL